MVRSRLGRDGVEKQIRSVIAGATAGHQAQHLLEQKHMLRHELEPLRPVKTG